MKMNEDLVEILESVLMENDREQCKVIIPKLIVQIKFLETFTKKIKVLKEQLDKAVGIVGEYDCEYYSILKKEKRSYKSDNFMNLLGDLQNSDLNEEQMKELDKVVEEFMQEQKELKVKKFNKKMEKLEKIKPGIVTGSQECIIKEILELKSKESLFQRDNENEETTDSGIVN